MDEGVTWIKFWMNCELITDRQILMPLSPTSIRIVCADCWILTFGSEIKVLISQTLVVKLVHHSPGLNRNVMQKRWF
jgi:hypothetical protein